MMKALEQVPKAFIVKQDEALTQDEVMTYLKQQLTSYKLPKYIEFVAGLPKSAVGKILRLASCLVCSVECQSLLRNDLMHYRFKKSGGSIGLGFLIMGGAYFLCGAVSGIFIKDRQYDPQKA